MTHVIQEERIRSLAQNFYDLTERQLYWFERISNQFKEPSTFKRNTDSDLITEAVLQDFGDMLRIHHCLSKGPFSKDKFEFALEWVLNMSGVDAKLAPPGNPGHDITINGVNFSLKSQAETGTNEEKIHISKFMELGRGIWADKIEDLIGLRERFFKHMEKYDRILILRRFPKTTVKQPRKLSVPKSFTIQPLFESTASKPKKKATYELVEIPKALLLEAERGKLDMCYDTTQKGSIPGYCHVYKNEESQEVKFDLYFDGGSERKLQIKNLLKEYCQVHATWDFILLSDQ